MKILTQFLKAEIKTKKKVKQNLIFTNNVSFTTTKNSISK